SGLAGRRTACPGDCRGWRSGCRVGVTLSRRDPPAPHATGTEQRAGAGSSRSMSSASGRGSPEVLPGDKARKIAHFQAAGRQVALVGDSVNDALARCPGRPGHRHRPAETCHRESAFGVVLLPEIAAPSMSGSSLVAVNALLLTRLRLPATPA